MQLASLAFLGMMLHLAMTVAILSSAPLLEGRDLVATLMLSGAWISAVVQFSGVISFANPMRMLLPLNYYPLMPNVSRCYHFN